MAYNTNKDLKLYYSISEVARMFNVNESLLRYWEKEFPIISPKKAGGNIRQYRKEDIENIRLVYHLVKEKGMTLQGAKQRLKANKEKTVKTAEVVSRLKEIREELVKLRKSLDYLTWKENLFFGVICGRSAIMQNIVHFLVYKRMKKAIFLEELSASWFNSSFSLFGYG